MGSVTKSKGIKLRRANPIQTAGLRAMRTCFRRSRVWLELQCLLCRLWCCSGRCPTTCWRLCCHDAGVHVEAASVRSSWKWTGSSGTYCQGLKVAGETSSDREKWHKTAQQAKMRPRPPNQRAGSKEGDLAQMVKLLSRPRLVLRQGDQLNRISALGFYLVVRTAPRKGTIVPILFQMATQWRRLKKEAPSKFSTQPFSA